MTNKDLIKKMNNINNFFIPFDYAEIIDYYLFVQLKKLKELFLSNSPTRSEL